jgi:phosphoribosylamine--glycine ligase
VLTDILAGRDPDLQWSDENVLGIVLASKGYPEEYENGHVITGLDKLDGETLLFHCGTAKTDDQSQFETKGGRVLFAARKAETLDAARKTLYADVKKIRCANLFYRTDI